MSLTNRLAVVAVVIALLSSAASMQTRVINGGRIQVGANDVSGIFQASVTLTNAQIKALPTTSMTVVAAPGAGLAIEPILAVLYGSTSAGAYTNIDTAGWLSLDHAAGVSRVPNDASITNGSATRLTDFLGSTTPKSVRLIPYASSEGVHVEGFVPSIVATSAVVNTALKVTISNGMAGDLTGGNAANTLTVLVLYRVIATVSPLTAICPANAAATSSDGSPVAVTYAAPTITGGTGPTGSYDIASGSDFSVGATTVTYSASSTDGQSATCTLTVTVTSLQGGHLLLAWDLAPGFENIDEYVVYYGTVPLTHNIGAIYVSGFALQGYDLTTLLIGTTYYVQIRSHNAVGYSGYSAEVSGVATAY